MNILTAVETVRFKWTNCTVWEYVSIKLLEYERHRAETRDSWETVKSDRDCERHRGRDQSP